MNEPGERKIKKFCVQNWYDKSCHKLRTLEQKFTTFYQEEHSACVKNNQELRTKQASVQAKHAKIIDDAANELQTLLASVGNLESQKTEWEAKHQAQITQLTSIQQQLQTCKSGQKQTDKQNLQTMTELKSQNQQLENQNKQLGKQITEQQNKLNKQEKLIGQQKQELETRGTNLDSRTTELERLRGEQKRHADEVNVAQFEKDECDKKLAAQIERSNTQIREFEQEFEQKKQSWEDRDNERVSQIAELQNQIQIQLRQIGELQNINAALVEFKTNVNLDMKQLKSGSWESYSRVPSIKDYQEAVVEQRNAEIGQREISDQRQEAEFENLLRQFEAQKKSLQESRKKFNSSVGEISELKTEKTTYKRAILKLKQELTKSQRRQKSIRDQEQETEKVQRDNLRLQRRLQAIEQENKQQTRTYGDTSTVDNNEVMEKMEEIVVKLMTIFKTRDIDDLERMLGQLGEIMDGSGWDEFYFKLGKALENVENKVDKFEIVGDVDIFISEMKQLKTLLTDDFTNDKLNIPDDFTNPNTKTLLDVFRLAYNLRNSKIPDNGFVQMSDTQNAANINNWMKYIIDQFTRPSTPDSS